jgi:hypothetical protein
MGSQVVSGLEVLCASAPWNIGVRILKMLKINTYEGSVRNRDGAPITANPSKLDAASKVGGSLASPISWV